MSGEHRESEVEVGLDPDTAFAVFTEELDYWWLRGPINNWDSARVRAMRCEPGVGGRLLEIYDETAGDMLELARITAWEPGQRLAWHSSVDDVAIEVLFEPVAAGTACFGSPPPFQQAARTPVGAASFGSLRRGSGGGCPSARPVRIAFRRPGASAWPSTIGEPARAARWLRDVFGLEPVLELDDAADEAGWIEFRIGDAAVMVLRSRGLTRSRSIAPDSRAVGLRRRLGRPLRPRARCRRHHRE